MYVISAVVCLIFHIFRCCLIVPANETYDTNDGKTIRIEYREENGTIYKVFSARQHK
jgi:hypothetical protein